MKGNFHVRFGERGGETRRPQGRKVRSAPTPRSGGMLLSAVAELKRQGQEYRNLQLYGQERNLMTSAIARMNLFLHGIEDFHVERGDTLSDPRFLAGDRLRRFDVILANPPYSIKQWNRDAWAADPYGRNVYGVPPQGRADYAFFQHIIASLHPRTGRCAILFPHGVLFRDEEQHMRAKLVEDAVLDCVIGLGPNLFYNSPMEACVVVCRTNKPPARRGRVLFINAVDEVTRERAQSFLERDHIDKIVAAYRAFDDVEGLARVATMDEIRANRANLSISLYVQTVTEGDGDDIKTLADAIAEWKASSTAVRTAMTELFQTLAQAGIE